MVTGAQILTLITTGFFDAWLLSVTGLLPSNRMISRCFFLGKKEKSIRGVDAAINILHTIFCTVRSVLCYTPL